MENSKKYYLVDYDSVKQNGVEGIENLTETEKVFIFYTEGNHTIEMSFFEKIHSSSADVKLRKISGNGSSSYIISAFAGHIIGSDKDTEVYIISSNTEYNGVIKLWKDNRNICMYDNILTIVSEKPVVGNTKKIPENTINNDEKTLSPEIEKAIEHFQLSTENKIFISDTLNKCQSRENISIALYSHFRNSCIYRAIAPYILKTKEIN